MAAHCLGHDSLDCCSCQQDLDSSAVQLSQFLKQLEGAIITFWKKNKLHFF